MATYAIGDLQGCYQTLQKLLKQINFAPNKDTLWLAGDLINRGKDSLATLEFLYQHRSSIRCVLGNHDLHFLAVESGQHSASKKDTFDEILNSPKRAELSLWLKQQPLFFYDQPLNFAMVHAGIPHFWNLSKVLALSNQVSRYIQSEKACLFFEKMYGNQPDSWSEQLEPIDQLRFITNALTRMRYCYADGRLELTHKMTPGEQPNKLIPWYQLDNNEINCDLVFGHWASLSGHCKNKNLFALDTGCVWGGQLTALRLDDKKYFSCDSIESSH